METYWHQKAKCKRLKEGDGYMSFFHKVTNGRKRKNILSSLMRGEEEIFNFEYISQEASSFFDELYKKERGERPVIDNLFDTTLQKPQVLELERPF